MPKRPRAESLRWPLEEREERLLPLKGFRILADVAFIHHDDAVLHTVSKLIAPSDPLFRTPT